MFCGCGCRLMELRLLFRAEAGGPLSNLREPPCGSLALAQQQQQQQPPAVPVSPSTFRCDDPPYGRTVAGIRPGQWLQPVDVEQPAMVVVEDFPHEASLNVKFPSKLPELMSSSSYTHALARLGSLGPTKGTLIKI